MSGRSFRSVFMVASCAGAALGCYLVSLRVASERAAVEDVETRIVLAQRDIRLLQTEIGTRGRLAQLERWNVKVLSLSAPSADQFLGGGFELARLVQPRQKVDIEAPVVLAAAREDTQRPRLEAAPEAAPEQRGLSRDLSPKALMQTVSLKRELPPEPELVRQRPVAADKPKVSVKPSAKPSAVEPSAATTPKKAAVPKKAAAVPTKAAAELKKAAAEPKKASAEPRKPAAEPKRKPAAADPLAAAPAKPKKIAQAVTKKETTKTP